MPQAKSQELKLEFGKKTRLAEGLYLIELNCPELAKRIQPGEFFNLKVPGDPSEILRLPFSYAASYPEQGIVELMYQEIGKGTKRLTEQVPGVSSNLLGPLGRGFSLPTATSANEECQGARVLLVAGGVGMAPLLPLAKSLAEQGYQIDFVLGAASADRAVLFDRLQAYGVARIYLSCDDGSAGYHGFCTEISAALMKQSKGYKLNEAELACLTVALKFGEAYQGTESYRAVYTCGPEVMQKKLAALAAEHELYCEVSLEKGMICGIGACMSCVTQLKDGRRPCVCTEGPVFDASEVDWDE